MHSVVVDTKYCTHTEQAILYSKLIQTLSIGYIIAVSHNIITVAITYIHEVILGVVIIVRVPETSTTHPVSLNF